MEMMELDYDGTEVNDFRVKLNCLTRTCLFCYVSTTRMSFFLFSILLSYHFLMMIY